MRWEDIFDDPTDASRCREVINILAVYISPTLVLTGSIAAELNLIQRTGATKAGLRLNDIDLVVMSVGQISPAIADKFLVNHFHPTREIGNVLFQLVEPRSRTRVDIFSPRSPTIMDRVSPVSIDECTLSYVSAEDLAARLGAIALNVAERKTVEGKYLKTLRSLLPVCDKSLVQELWQAYRKDLQPTRFEQALEEIETSAADKPYLLQPSVYSKDLDLKCEWCVATNDFPIAEKKEIFEVLGHV